MEINLQQLEKRLENVEHEVHKMSKTVELVYDVLKGNELDDAAGIVKKVNGIDNRVKALEDTEKKEGWTNKLFWAGVGVIIIKLVDTIISKL